MDQTITERADIYKRVTDSIVASIEAGAGAWRMPWHSGADGLAPRLPVSLATGRTYRGVNTVVLWASGQARSYGSAVWGTYRQWQERGAQVRKGEQASPVVFWKAMDRSGAEAGSEKQEDATGSRRFVARGYSVFNADQVDGFEPGAPVLLPETQRIERAELFFDGVGVVVRHGGNRAFYRPVQDCIQMPPFAAFADALSYYAVLAHEVTHWTAHASRCARDLGSRFGDESYAAEELVAELGAAFLCADLGLAVTPRPDHAAYVQSWLKVLRGDSRAIFTAAAKAQAAADYIHGRITLRHQTETGEAVA
ncbi:ArdC family protein [Lichenicoccus roseus]|uniref:DUF1738 domain-containing protein n=1 Tax=Lichenicoccus roseus TaxID=2683649 RepID=A0A5R9J4T9_9PROT|nr:zincin-like metallopeptidase domain-containing protein [Lichenicoccus roseus]TLU70631.1 DUF1738 domain-containing protein [Lichenicoccus roseus]